MPIAATHLATAASDADATSYTTASIAPGSGRLVLAWVSNEVEAGVPAVPTLTGNGLNYVQVATVVVGFTRLSLFRAMGLAPSAGTVAIAFGAQTQIGASWSISHFLGTNQGGTDGSGAIVQAVTNSNAAATTLVVTLAAFASANNATAGGFRHALAENATAGTGFAILGQANGAAPARNHASEFRATTDTTVDATWATVADNLGIAVELAVGGERITAPRHVVEAPLREPWPHSLVETARRTGHLIDQTTDRFVAGLSLAPRICAPVETYDLCVTVDLEDEGSRPAPLDFSPLVLVGRDICSPVQWRAENGETRAREHLATMGSKAIEADLWAAMAVPATTIIGGGLLTLAFGLASLVQAIADGSSGSGVIHARPRLVEMWDSVGLLHEDDTDGVIYTLTGIPVVPGSGYPGTGPSAQAVSANSEWAFATDEVDVHMGPGELVGGDLIGSTNRVTNVTAWRVEMGAVAVWGGCLTVAVEIDPTP